MKKKSSLADFAAPLLPATQVPLPPPWLDAAQYPFESRYFLTPAGRLHYLDEGSGETLVFVHGTPTWSFLWRRQIQALAGQYRCIAPDHLGYGLSDKPESWDYHPQSHADNLERLLEHLQVRDITLVVHDFGGPIGLAYALRCPERVKRLVLLNTWLWSTADVPQARQADRLLHSWLGRLMYLRLNFSAKVLLKQGFADQRKLTAALHRQYTAPFPSKNSRWGVLKTGQWLLRAAAWYAAREQELSRLAAKPVLLLWAMQDPFFKPEDLTRWQKLLHKAQTAQLESGHFSPEEQPEALTAELQRFLT